MAIAIVTDSTSDISRTRAQELGVTVVPLFVVWGERSYRDDVDLSRADFYGMLATEPTLPTTSQPTAAMFEAAFEPAIQRGDHVLCVVISSKLSGTINAAHAAATRFPPGSVTIFDSESAAGGLGMHVLLAQGLARGGAALAAIVDALERERATQRLFACVPDLAHLQRTGRIGKARAALGTLMKIVPVLCLKEGQVAAEAQVRTLARARETMLDLALQNTPDISEARYVVMHTNAPNLAQDVVERLRARFEGVKPKMLDVLEAGPVIATHAGPGAVGIFSTRP
ncbi:MAG TPA: DegV family protein [Verrucomicrobiae bacterium]|jgi:DegV family protein with EDD domain|nr:DegV family protein [Verrucomicrobiae bacterium]